MRDPTVTEKNIHFIRAISIANTFLFITHDFLQTYKPALISSLFASQQMIF